MSRPHAILAVLLGAACLPAAGCGSSAGPQTVRVSLTAPTNGSTVDVAHIEVLGTISPKQATLRLAGKRVRVRDGVFSTPMSLRRGLTRITIVATEPGFNRSSMTISVRYAPPSGAPPGSGDGGAAGGGSSSGVSSGTSVTGSGVRRSFFDAVAVSTCPSGGVAKTARCTCLFDAMARAGFDTEAKWQALITGWRRSFLAHGVIVYPPAVKDAILTCARQFHGQ